MQLSENRSRSGDATSNMQRLENMGCKGAAPRMTNVSNYWNADIDFVSQHDLYYKKI